MFDHLRVMTVERSEHCLDWVIQLVNIRISVRNLRGADTYSSTPARGRTQHSTEQLMWQFLDTLNLFYVFVFWLDRLTHSTIWSRGRKFFVIITLNRHASNQNFKVWSENGGNYFVFCVFQSFKCYLLPHGSNTAMLINNNCKLIIVKAYERL